MSRTHKRSSFLPIVVAAAMALPIMAHASSSAHADVTIRARGHVDARAGKPRVRVRHRHHRHRTHRPAVRLHVGGGMYWSGGIYVGRTYAPPPPPPPPPPPVCDCAPTSVPAYYTPAPAYTPAPVAPRAEPAPAMYGAYQAAPPLPRLGIGVFAGSVAVDNRMQGDDLGVLGRLRLTESLIVEAELARTEMRGNDRIDRRIGGSLLYDFSPRSKWSAHLLAGLGRTQMELGHGDWFAEQGYGELGAGLTWQLTRTLHLVGDLRAGARTPVSSASSDQTLRVVAPAPSEEETYTRGRLSAVLYF